MDKLHLALHAWRDRWARSEESQADKPYATGAAHKGLYRFANASIWRLPYAELLAIALSTLFLYLLLQVKFNLNGQITFAALVLVLVLAARRLEGSLFGLLTMYLATMSAAHYLYWRAANTIVIRSQVELTLSLFWLVVEFILICFVLVQACARLWPEHHGESLQTLNDEQLPKVNLILPLDSLSSQAALAFLKQVQALDWPQSRQTRTLIDSAQRPEIALFAKRAQWPEPQKLDGQSALQSLDRILNESQGDFSLLIDPMRQVDLRLLKKIMPWFSLPTGLHMLYSLNHPLSPKVSPELFVRDGGMSSFLLLRNRQWQALQIFKNLPFGQKLGALKPYSALVTFDKEEGYRRHDRADSSSKLKAKRALSKAQSLLLFYQPVLLLCILTLPAVILFKHWQVISTNIQWWLCMALPAYIALYSLTLRDHPKRRWGSLSLVKELALSALLSLRTSFGLVHSAVLQPRKFAHHLLMTTGYGRRAAWIGFNLLGLLVGLNSWHNDSGQEGLGNDGSLLLSLVCLWNVIHLLCQQAVLHEQVEVITYQSNLVHIPGTLRCSENRTLSCKVRNIREEPLCLLLPEQVGLASEQRFELQLFHGDTPLNLTVHSVGVDRDRLWVNTDNTSGNDLTHLREQLLSRPKEWPAWLPGQKADQVLPSWMRDRLELVPGKLIEMMNKVTIVFRLKDLIELIKK